MCLGMNPDQLAPGERSASTSNRNFEGRQGKGGRTHLVSPLVAAATAVRGTLSSPGRPRLTRRATPALTRWTPFTTHTGVGVPLRRSNVDTDQIIPAVYLKRVTRTGFEDGLFSAWRKDPRSSSTSPPFARARCWSPARTSAPVVARARRLGADGLRLPRGDLARGSATSSAATRARGPAHRARSAQPDVELLWKLLENEPGTELTVDLRDDARCRPRTSRCPFEIDDYTRWRLLEGLDDIGLTLRHADDIATFETGRPGRLPTTIG